MNQDLEICEKKMLKSNGNNESMLNKNKNHIFSTLTGATVRTFWLVSPG